jgi:hypothetical protein
MLRTQLTRSNALRRHVRWASTGAPSWWGVQDARRFKATENTSLLAGPGRFLSATHANELSFARDAAQALQVVLDSALSDPEQAARLFGDSTQSPQEHQQLQAQLRDLVGDQLREVLAKGAGEPQEGGGERRRVWVHAASIADVRAHGIAYEPAARDAAQGGLVYDPITNSLVELREGVPPRLLQPWGVSMTRPGSIRPRIPSIDNQSELRIKSLGKSSELSTEALMQDVAKEAEAEQQSGAGRGGVFGPRIPSHMLSSSKVLVQARIVFGTLEERDGKILAPPGEGLEMEDLPGHELPRKWRSKLWSDSRGAAVKQWGRATDSEVGDELNQPISEQQEGPTDEIVKTFSDLSDRQNNALSESARGWFREFLAKVKPQGEGQASVEMLRSYFLESTLASVRQRMASGMLDREGDIATAAKEEWQEGIEDREMSELRPLGGLVDGDSWSMEEQVRFQQTLARYTHWHSAVFELELSRAPPPWSRRMQWQDLPDEESEESDEDEEEEAPRKPASSGRRRGRLVSDDDHEERAKGKALLQDLQRGVRADAPGRRGAGPAAYTGMEALGMRIKWAFGGVMGGLVAAVARLMGSYIPRGPDLVPASSGWKLVSVDEALPPGVWEADRRAGEAWGTATAMAWGRVSEDPATLGKATTSTALLPLIADVLFTPLPAGDSGFHGLANSAILLARTDAPLMRHWSPVALYNSMRSANIQAAMEQYATIRAVGEAATPSSVGDDDADDPAESSSGTDELFGVTWHDGWHGLEGNPGDAANFRPSVGGMLGMGDGRWTAEETSILAWWQLEESVASKIVEKARASLGRIVPVGALGRLSMGKGAKTETEEPKKEEEEEEEELPAIDKESTGYAPTPPLWAKQALQSLVNRAKTSPGDEQRA